MARTKVSDETKALMDKEATATQARYADWFFKETGLDRDENSELVLRLGVRLYKDFQTDPATKAARDDEREARAAEAEERKAARAEAKAAKSETAAPAKKTAAKTAAKKAPAKKAARPRPKPRSAGSTAAF